MNPEVAYFEAIAKELMQRCIAENDPEDIRRWLNDTIARMGGAGSEDAILTWPASFDLVDEIIAKYEQIAATPESERKVLSWPWESWRKKIDTMEPGMLATVTAPDGQGKTIYAESITEYWAEHRNRVVFVHYELNRNLMMLRRTARHASITPRQVKEGTLTKEQKDKIAEIRPRLLAWDGYITYLHTPGWTMERTIAELRRLLADGQVDAVALDYLEKVSASTRQIKLFGTNVYQREADNVEQLKNFSEDTGVPVLMVAQMSKAGKHESADKMDRSGIRGAGEKSDKANIVVLLKRDRVDDGYSNTVDVMVDKNTMGGTGQFQQIMQPEYYRVGDIYIPPNGQRPTK